MYSLFDRKEPKKQSQDTIYQKLLSATTKGSVFLSSTLSSLFLFFFSKSVFSQSHSVEGTLASALLSQKVGGPQ